MALHIRVNSHAPSTKVGYAFAGRVNLSNTGDVLHYIAVNMDLLGLLLRDGHHWYVRGGFSNLFRTFSLYGQSVADEDMIVSSAPLKAPRGIGSAYEKRYHGSISRGILIFTSVIAGKSFTAPSSDREHACEHFTYSGELIASGADIPLYPPLTIPFCSHYVTEIENTGRRCWVEGRISALHPLSMTIADEWADPFAEFVNLTSFIDNSVGKVFVYVFSWNGTVWTSQMRNLRYETDYSGCTVRYTMEVNGVGGGPPPQHYLWEASFFIPFRVDEHLRQPVVGSSYRVLPYEPCVFTYDFSTAYPWTGAMHQQFTAPAGYDLHVYPILLSQPLSTTEEYSRCLDARLFFSERNMLGSFRDAIQDSWDDIVPSTMFSTVDAYKAAEGSLGTNVLQNLAKLPGLVDSLPQIREAVNILGRLVRRDLSGALIKDILDLATSTTLQANFEWRPYLKYVTEYLPGLASTLQTLSDMREGSVIGYGSFRYKLFQQLGRKEVTLLTRTKLVMDASPSGLLSAVLGLDALGLLPKMSNIWDLIPFSFVANWFTGVGEALRRAEYSLLLATIPAYFVHTYAITSPLTTEELDSMKMSSSGVESPSLRIYCRDVTLYSPFPRESRFGFGIPSGFPPLGTFGSLLYQLIFS